MDEPFEIPVAYKGQQLLFPAQLLQLGYTHAFAVTVEGQELRFEPDEEQHYRAVVPPEEQSGRNAIPVELLKAIADAIEAILK